MRLKRPLERALVSLGHGDDAGVQRRLCTRAPTVERLLTSDLELVARDCGLDHAPLKQLAASVASASVQPVRTARQLLAARRAEAQLRAVPLKDDGRVLATATHVRRQVVGRVAERLEPAWT